MNFAFGEEDEAIREAARSLLDKISTSETWHKAADAGKGQEDRLWKELAENGWLGAVVPGDLGGSELSYTSLCVLAEEMGYALAPVPFSSSVYLVTEAVLAFGSPEQKKSYLPDLASGKSVGALAVAEKGVMHPSACTLSVKNGKLQGSKWPVADGMPASLALVLAKDGAGLSLFLAPLKEARKTALPSLDPTRSLARIDFDGVAAERLGEAGKGAELLERLWDRAGVLFAYEALGGASRCLHMGTEYAKARYAFGRPIGSFQAIKHRLADMFAKTELARSNCYYGAWALSKDVPELRGASGLSQWIAQDAFVFGAQENVQIHGGIGFTWEADPHLFTKRAKFIEHGCGGRREWGERVLAVIQ